MTSTPTITRWEAADPASPALLDLLFDDMGIGKGDYSRSESPEQKELAREATKNYFTEQIKDGSEEGAPLTMGEVNQTAYVFYDAYLAGLAGKTHPESS